MKYECGDFVKFLPRNILEVIFDEVVGNSTRTYPTYKDAILNLANKTFHVDNANFLGGRFTLAGNDPGTFAYNNNKWIIYPEFVTLVDEETNFNGSIPDLLGDLIYEGE